MSRYALLMKPELWGAIACLLLALVSGSLGILLFLCIFVYGLIFALIKHSERRAQLRSLSILWLFIWLSCLPLMVGHNASGGVFGWGIAHEGINLALRVALRAMCAVGAVRLLLIAVPFYELVRGLRQMGVSSLLMDLLELSYRYINVLLHSAEQIRLAQLSRLAYIGGWLSNSSQAALLVSRSFVLAHSNADRLYDGLRSRGLEGLAQHTECMPSADSELLRVEHLSFAYGSEAEALKGVSLSASKGERIVLLGENGAGKSTLMRILSGLQAGYSGEIVLNSEPIKQSKADDRRLRSTVALVFQNSNHQLFCPTVEDELAFGLRNLGYDQTTIEARVADALVRYQLESLRHKAPHELSEGQKKWVCLAAVLLTSPSIILLDEPTAALDRYYTRKVLGLLDELSLEGKTIILSTHDMYLADRWAERAWVMHEGRLISDTSLAELWAKADVLQEANLEPPHPYHLAEPKEVRPNTSYKLLLAHSNAQRACIIGSGRGALRKAMTLLEAGLHCTIVSPDTEPDTVTKWTERGQLQWQKARWEKTSPLPHGVDIVIAGTDNPSINQSIVEAARQRGLLYCTLSDPEAGNIQFVAQAGSSIRIGVHTDYQLPEVAQAIRDQAMQRISSLPEQSLTHLSDLRQKWLVSRTEEDQQRYDTAKEDIITNYLSSIQ